MKKVIVLLILIVVSNFLYLSVGYGQTNFNIQAVVPLTDKNLESTLQSQVEKPANRVTTKENKYIYFFEKSLLLAEVDSFEYAQTAHDRFSSYAIMVFFLLITAIIMFMILRLMDHLVYYIKSHYHNYDKK